MKINAIRFSKDVFEEKNLSSLLEIEHLLTDDTILWIDITDPERREDLEILEKTLGLHPLALNDCMNIRQRPKVEDYEDLLFVIARGIEHDTEKGIFMEGLQLGIFLKKSLVITVHKHLIPLKDIKENIKIRKPPIDRGASFLLYIILDIIVDSFEVEGRSLEERVRKVENKVLNRPSHETLTEIFTTRQNLLLLRKIIRPQRDAIYMLIDGSHSLIHSSVSFYLRDVQDHIERTLDIINTQLEILSSSLNVYLSATSNMMNDIIKMLTMINTIFMPLTLIIGLYTITFPAPFTAWKFAPILTVFSMITIVSLILILFKKKNYF
jgi:magnesium transporter